MPVPATRIVVWGKENNWEIVLLLTNHMQFGATTISAIYKERCQIELFFKTLKQNLKTFVDPSAGFAGAAATHGGCLAQPGKPARFPPDFFLTNFGEAPKAIA